MIDECQRSAPNITPHPRPSRGANPSSQALVKATVRGLVAALLACGHSGKTSASALFASTGLAEAHEIAQKRVITYKKGVSANGRQTEMMAIVAAQSVSAFFGEAIEDAMRSRHVEATNEATRYLVALLADFAHPDRRTGETLERPLTLLLDEALRMADAAERFEQLRTIGDGVLYGCGFFGDHFEARGVDPKYLCSLGTRAYDAAGSMLRRGNTDHGSDLFGELAHKFDLFVGVVGDVADATITMGMENSKGLLNVYERWLRTGSERLANALTSHGVMPTRGSKGTLQ